MLSLVALTSLFNTLTRVFCDPSLKQKLAFWRRNKNHNGSVYSENSPYEQNKDLAEQLIDSKDIGDRPSKKNNHISGQIYDRLTQTETLNVSI